MGRGRQALHRLRRLVGSDDPRGTHPAVVEAVQEAALTGLSFGAPTQAEIELAELSCRLRAVDGAGAPVSSGTEATMTAIRLARGYTGRSLIVKFEGLLPRPCRRAAGQGGLGRAHLRQPELGRRAGGTAAHTLVLDFNDVDQLERVSPKQGDEIAAVIVEPVAGNMNLVLPAPGFLETLREECTRTARC